ncbi:hypothetical protein RYA05_02190 [Pseudomonas syringae pv. actinidiae]|nr:hypothetical protein [Pseudomonas syringae pv. actinidiae]
MDYLIDFVTLAVEIQSATRPKNFRKVSDYSAAKRRNKLIDELILSGEGGVANDAAEMKILLAMQDILSEARYRAQSLGPENRYCAALAALGKAVDVQITRIDKAGTDNWHREREQARKESLEKIAQERVMRLQEPKFDIAEAWENLKKKMTSEKLRSVSQFKAASAAIEQVDLLLANNPAVVHGGEEEQEALERLLESVWKLPVHSAEHGGMSGDIAAQSVCEAIANAAQYRLGQITYEIDTRPENILKSWDTPFA